MVPTVATIPLDGQEPGPAQPVVICAPSWAAGVDLVVEGANFYPRILEDMERAESSIHIVQFGFKPGKVGDRLAERPFAEGSRGRGGADLRGRERQRHRRQ